MLAVAFPSNASMAFALIIDLANLKIIPVDWIIEKVTGIANKGNKSSFGYSDNILQSMGMVFVGLVLVLFGVLVGLALFKLFKTVPIVKKVLTMLADKILFNTFIRTFIASYLIFSLSAFRNLKAMSFTTGGEVISSIIALGITCVCVFAPVLMLAFLSKNLA